MAEYSYVAISSSGSRIEGKKTSENQQELINSLIAKGLTVISIRESIGFNFNRLSSTEIGGVPLTEKVLLIKQLATMISAGIPIIQAIGILEDQVEKPSLKEKLTEIYRKIESGFTLSKAFEEAGGILNEVQMNLLSAGEKSGNLNEMLLKVADDLEKSKNLRGKIVGALIYPVIIFVVLAGVIGLMIVVMVPQVTELYISLGKTKEDIPFITRMLVVIGDSLSNPFFIFILIISIVFSYLGFKIYVQDEERRIAVDRVKLKIPIFGNLMRKVQLSEFCRVLSMLLKSGVPIIEAIDIVSKALSNNLYKRILIESKKELTKGTALSLAIAKNNQKNAFPTILIKIMATGEESGKFDKVLDDMNRFYETEVEQITSNLTKLMEPFILVVVGGLVALLAVAIYLPIYNVGNIVQ